MVFTSPSDSTAKQFIESHFGLIPKLKMFKPSFGNNEQHFAASVKTIYFPPSTWLLDMVLTEAAFLLHVPLVPDTSAPLF